MIQFMIGLNNYNGYPVPVSYARGDTGPCLLSGNLLRHFNFFIPGLDKPPGTPCQNRRNAHTVSIAVIDKLHRALKGICPVEICYHLAFIMKCDYRIPLLHLKNDLNIIDLKQDYSVGECRGR